MEFPTHELLETLDAITFPNWQDNDPWMDNIPVLLKEGWINLSLEAKWAAWAVASFKSKGETWYSEEEWII